MNGRRAKQHREQIARMTKALTEAHHVVNALLDQRDALKAELDEIKSAPNGTQFRIIDGEVCKIVEGVPPSMSTH